MKMISRISATVVMLSVAALGSGGAWTWVALACGLVGMLTLFVACGSLGYFDAPPRVETVADVVSLDERRRRPPAAAGPSAARRESLRLTAR